MSGQSRNPGLFAEDPGPSDEPESSGRVRQTQLERVLRMLVETDEVCGSVFYRAYIPRFAVHIHRLRKAGNVISKRPCDLGSHDHEGTQWLYRLEALPFDPKPS